MTCLLLVVTPGPDTLYVLSRSIEQGRKAGELSAIGICCGFFVHIIAAVVGLSALLMASATAFTIIKYLGAGYLIYLGVRTLLARAHAPAIQPLAPLAQSQLVLQGMFINALNPKVAIFFLAFIPQFIDLSRSSFSQQIIGFGLINIGMCFVWLNLIALVAGSIRGWLTGYDTFWKVQKWVSGSVMILLGVRLLFSEKPA